MPSPATDVLLLNNLACMKGERLLFSGLSLEIPAGSLVQVTGANGVGKTSLLRMLAGLSEPAKGTLIWRGLDSRIERSAFVQDLLYLGHASAIKDELLPVENVMASCVLQGEECSESQVRAVLNQLGLGDRLEVESLSLSAGQRRKIALARLWLTHRPIWLLDEPFNALDGLAVRQLSQRISDHVQAQGICLFTTHQLVEIKAERYLTLALDPFSASFNSRTQQNEVTR